MEKKGWGHPFYNRCDGWISCVMDEKMKVRVHELCASMNEKLMMMDELHPFGWKGNSHGWFSFMSDKLR